MIINLYAWIVQVWTCKGSQSEEEELLYILRTVYNLKLLLKPFFKDLLKI